MREKAISMLIETLSENKKGKELIIAALGDSLTYGWMVSKGYIDFLKEMIKARYPESGVNILNLGVPGDTAEDGLRRVIEVIRNKPDLVMIQFALNDAFCGHTPERFKRNIESIIMRIKQDTDAAILLLTSVPVMYSPEDKIAENFYNKIKECGSEYNIPVVCVHEYWKKKITGGAPFSSLLQGDGIHPLEKGYRLMAEAVMEFL